MKGKQRNSKKNSGWMKRLQSMPYKKKIIWELTVLSLLPILLLTFFSAYMIRKDTQDRMDLISAQRVERVSERTDRILWSIWESYFEIFMTDEIEKVMTQNLSYKDYSIYAKAIEALEGQTYLRDYIRGFSFINLETQWVLSNRGMYLFQEALNHDEVWNILNEKEHYAGKLVNSGKKVQYDLSHNTIDTNGVYMLFCLPMNAKEPECVVMVNLNMDAFQEFIDEGDEYKVTITDKDNKLLLTTDTVEADFFEEYPEKMQEKTWVRMKNGRKIRISSVLEDSDYFNYIVTYDSSMIGRESQRIISLSLVLVGVIVTTGIAVIVTGRKVYEPILGLKNIISDGVYTDQNDKGDDIRFIEKNISYMILTIRNQKKEMVRFLMSRLLSGTIQREEIKQYWSELELPFFSDYCVMTLTLSMEAMGHQEMERNILLNAIEGGVVLKKEIKGMISSRVWNKVLVILIGGKTEEDVEKNIITAESTIRLYLRQNGMDKVQFGASQIFTDIEYVMRAYHEAVEAAKISEMEYAQGGSHGLIMYADIAKNMEAFSFYPIATENRIKDLVDACKEKEACIEAGRMIDELYKQRIAASERRYYVCRLLLSILEVSNDAGLPISEIRTSRGNDLLFEFSQIYGSEDIKSFINRQVIPGVIESLREFRSTHSLDIRDKVMKMIRKSKGDITLTECAEKLNYSVSYLGRILRCENNDSFSAYVAEQKLVYAKSLLEETDRSVADIAKELNYANTQNFIRFFNKWTGMTPGKYRDSQRQTEKIKKNEKE